MDTIIAEESFLAICIATNNAPPVDAPENTPSFVASNLAVFSASSWPTFITESIFFLVNILGRYSSGHFLIPGICDPSSG